MRNKDNNTMTSKPNSMLDIREAIASITIRKVVYLQFTLDKQAIEDNHSGKPDI